MAKRFTKIEESRDADSHMQGALSILSTPTLQNAIKTPRTSHGLPGRPNLLNLLFDQPLPFLLCYTLPQYLAAISTPLVRHERPILTTWLYVTYTISVSKRRKVFPAVFLDHLHACHLSLQHVNLLLCPSSQSFHDLSRADENVTDLLDGKASGAATEVMVCSIGWSRSVLLHRLACSTTLVLTVFSTPQRNSRNTHVRFLI